MCGIVGYIGVSDAARPLYFGLEKLLYRGYDSAGMGFVDGGAIRVLKQPDKELRKLQERLVMCPSWGTLGIGHTRWATHGVPSEVNAHPHLSPSGKIAIVHNGMVENLAALKRLIDEEDLLSATDTEVIVHLIERERSSAASLEAAVRGALLRVEGAYAVAIIAADEPDKLVVAAHGSPLAIGTTNSFDEWFVASGTEAFPERVRLIEYLRDGELAILRRGLPCQIEKVAPTAEGRASNLTAFDADAVRADKGAFMHFMRKELADMPVALGNTLRGHIEAGKGRVHLGGFADPDTALRFRDVSHVVIAACGTSLYAGQVGKRLIEQLVHVRTEAVDAAEWLGGAALVDSHDLFIAVSQSGETRDVVEAFKLAKARGALTFAVNNRVGSQLHRESVRGLFLRAGPETSVASTKAFICQVASLALIAAKLANLRREPHGALLDALAALPSQVAEVFRHENTLKALAWEYAKAPNVLLIGRGFCAPVAREGALKLQEIAYHPGAHGFTGSELKHGPLALVEDGTPVIAIVPKGDSQRQKMLGNISEALARGAKVIALTTGADEEVLRLEPPGRIRAIEMPETCAPLYPILAAPIVQLFAYHMGVARGVDIDQPRNLAKSVTVE